MSEPVRIGEAELWLGDCREILPTLRICRVCDGEKLVTPMGAEDQVCWECDGSGKRTIDAAITDPPYGVAFKGSATRHSLPTGQTYVGFDDSPDFVRDVCVPAVEIARTIAKRVLLTPGIKNARLYPQPDGEGVIWYPSGANRGPWGFVTHQPIFYYGKCPFLATGRGSHPTGFASVEAAEDNGHPCPKPIRQMTWLVARASLPGETVCDPFMGSGTTGVACAQLGRKFIGIEIEPKYFDIACKRIEAAYAQGRLFEPEAQKPEQVSLLDGAA